MHPWDILIYFLTKQPRLFSVYRQVSLSLSQGCIAIMIRLSLIGVLGQSMIISSGVYCPDIYKTYINIESSRLLGCRHLKLVNLDRPCQAYELVNVSVDIEIEIGA